ncbi:twin-arginine translocase TatA/TatE family subunit [uncultured Nocardioides sp.]|uniref:twin-arginine translocase TatA/TatE family subunit n=1 Tax=uncultured Nocardioides sp. TaxID=198441 RepID=UPI0026025A02|nr:twin-arginine translocase TatA/TatE family subunit [uncultured Nocardioides sp.]
MLQNLTGWHALIILAVVLLVFGSSKLPGLARSVGESMRILKDETARPDHADRADRADQRDRADRSAVEEPQLRRTAS